jgi:glycosyltransferase involved in cell wall biosynthesis
LNLIRQLSGKNWNTSIITTSTSNNEWKSEFEDLTKDVFILPDFLNIVDYVDFINYLIFSRGIDVVFLQGSIEGYRLLPIIRNSNPGLIIVDYLHFITEDWMKGGFPKLSYLYHDYLDKSIVSCKQVKDWMVNSHIDENKIEVCYIGVDPNVWKHDIVCRNEFRNKLSIRPDEFVLLYAARLEEQKQPLLLIETLHILKHLLQAMAVYGEKSKPK